MSNHKMGVYQMLNLSNGKKYVGATKNLVSRKRQHFSDLKLHKHGNPNLQNDYDIYGKNQFLFSVLEMIFDEELLIENEQKWLDYLNPEYNVNKIAGKYMGEYVRSPEAKEKRHRTMLGRKQSQNEKEKHRQSMLKYHANHPEHPFQSMSLEQRQEYGRKGALALMERGYKHTDATKQKIGNSNAKTYHGFISPDGVVYSPVHNLKRFCEEQNLLISSMVAVDHERRKHHKGWKKLYDHQNQ